MTLGYSPNINMIIRMAQKLDWLLDRLVFVGGATTELLLTEHPNIGIRATKDVDVIVEATTRSDYYRLEAELRHHGYNQDLIEGGPICRWLIDDIVVDFMPDLPHIIGFSNKWYPDAIKNCLTIPLQQGIIIRAVSPPYFLATKMEAFIGRGKGDYLMSHDIEDMITLIDRRAEIINDVKASGEKLQQYLSKKFSVLLEDNHFVDSIPGHLLPDKANQGRYPMIVNRIKEIKDLLKSD